MAARVRAERPLLKLHSHRVLNERPAGNSENLASQRYPISGNVWPVVCLKKVPYLPCQQLASAPGVNLFIEYLTPDWVQCKWAPIQYTVSGNIRSYYELTRLPRRGASETRGRASLAWTS